ncbi:MAG: hypothetical protein RI568_01325 [Natronomonas sp.]|uniref:hypothetical protein n=1 Tax=Natronomonas sp. TaxID=2184060 RepID=UPI00286FB1D4|nr:hypothetical protein [Natronomonas sp.]MDR9429338.1 hypothetical protein [Natronomonas sp.]
MIETHWPELQGKELRYLEHAWELTGTVDVRDRGELLAVEARQADDVTREETTLHFAIESPGDSLNPGDLGEHFDRLERTDDAQYLLVKKAHRTYRYELQRLEHA